MYVCVRRCSCFRKSPFAHSCGAHFCVLFILVVGRCYCGWQNEWLAISILHNSCLLFLLFFAIFLHFPRIALAYFKDSESLPFFVRFLLNYPCNSKRIEALLQVLIGFGMQLRCGSRLQELKSQHLPPSHTHIRLHLVTPHI